MHPGAHAEHQPDKAAYVMGRTGETVSYRELDEGSNRLAWLLHERGLRTGDSIALWMGNNAVFLQAAWAPHRSGLYYTAISSMLTPAEAAYIIADCGAQALITSYDLAEEATELLALTPAVHTRLMVGGTVNGFEPYHETVGPMPTRPVPGAVEGRQMLYSSGTTGRPKGVKMPLTGKPVGEPDSALTMARHLYHFDQDSVLLSPAPLYHAAPLRFTMAMTRVGGTSVIMERFDPVELLALVERYGVTHALLVPTMFVRLLKLPPEERAAFDLSTLRCCVHGAAPCPVPVKEQMIDWWGPVLHEYYAGTEENGFVACTSEEWLAHPGTVGKPVMCSVHVLDENGRELPPGQPGAVYFESTTRFEYHNDPEKTRSSFNDKGWSTLGDVGYLDEDGYLYLTDRQAFTIISGGVNVYPQEAENVLVTHPKVGDAAVFGVPDPDMGEAVKAVVEPLDMSDAGPGLEQELISYCRDQLASFKCPRSIEFEAALPRHPTGKLYKRVLSDRYRNTTSAD